MPRRFHVGVRVDSERKLIIFAMNGEIDTPAMVARWQDIYAGMSEPWMYDRLIDYRRASGMVNYDQLSGFADWWRQLTLGITYSSRVAIVVNNALDAARVNTVRSLFPNDVRRSFMTLDEALEWLNESAAAPQGPDPCPERQRVSPPHV